MSKPIDDDTPLSPEEARRYIRGLLQRSVVIDQPDSEEDDPADA